MDEPEPDCRHVRSACSVGAGSDCVCAGGGSGVGTGMCIQYRVWKFSGPDQPADGRDNPRHSAKKGQQPDSAENSAVHI